MSHLYLEPKSIGDTETLVCCVYSAEAGKFPQTSMAFFVLSYSYF